MDVIEGLYPAFLELGYSPEAFWDYSIAEIMDLMAAYQKREERRQKEKIEEFKNLAIALQVQALQIGQTFGGTDDQHPLKTVQEYYPFLFPKNAETEKRKYQKQLDERNARLRAAAAAHNARIREAKGGGEP